MTKLKNSKCNKTKKLKMKFFFQNMTQKNQNVTKHNKRTKPYSLNQALRFCGLCCSVSQIRNWAICKTNFEPNSINWQKKWKLVMRKVEMYNTVQYFHSKHLKHLPKRHEKHFIWIEWCFRAKQIFSIIDCKPILYANFTKLRGSLNVT